MSEEEYFNLFDIIASIILEVSKNKSFEQYKCNPDKVYIINEFVSSGKYM